MKTTRIPLIGLALCIVLSGPYLCPSRAANGSRAAETNVLEMKSVPDGHFLVNLQWDGKERLVNIEVKDQAAKCVNSNDARLKGLQGRFELIGNGVFLVTFRNANHTASQHWIFRKDGTANVKEIPDRGGEKQLAIAVETDSLEMPKKDR